MGRARITIILARDEIIGEMEMRRNYRKKYRFPPWKFHDFACRNWANIVARKSNIVARILTFSRDRIGQPKCSSKPITRMKVTRRALVRVEHSREKDT